MAEDSSSPDKLKEINDRLNYIESVARETVARLYGIEQHLGLVFRAVPRELKTPAVESEREAHLARLRAVEESLKIAAPPELPLAPESGAPAQTPPAVISKTQGDAPSIPPRRPAVPPTEPRPAGAAPPYKRVLNVPVPQGPPPVVPRTSEERAPTVSFKQTKPGGDLESRIGGNWFNRIGVLAIFLGVTFFLKYAVDNQWIGPAGRVLIGAAIGIAFLIGGERLRTRYSSYAYGLTGGGIAVLYASIWFASGKRYGLIAPAVAFALMALVTATASLLAARYSALPIAVLGLIGGFLTPILLSTGVDNEAGLFSYIAVLDAGVLALAYSKRWRSLNYMSFIATVLMFAAWMSEWYAPGKLWTTIFFLTLFFMIFALLSVLHNVVNRRPTSWLDLAMVFSNALLYFGTSYKLLDEQTRYQGMLGLFALLVALFYLGLGYFTYRRDREDSLLVFTFLGLGFLFSVLAVPIQFDQHWLTIGWALEGAVMTWIGLRANDRTSRYGALVVFAVALSHWVMVDVHDFAYGTPGDFVPLLNRRALSCAVLVAALAVAAFFYKREGEKVEERGAFASLLFLSANALAIAVLTLDANDYFEQRKALASGQDFVNSLGNTKALTLTALWTIYGMGTLFVGITRKMKALRFLGLLLMATATVKVFLVDLRYYEASWHSLIVNQTFAAFALIIAALAFSASFYSRSQDMDDERDSIRPILIGGANVLAIIALSAEVIGHYHRVGLEPGAEANRIENNKQFVLSALWTIYGATAFVIGIKRRTQALRAGALLLLAIAAAKLLAVDLPYYNAEWHKLILNQTFGAFALIILALVCCAWFYAHSKDPDDDERAVVLPILIGAANLLAVIALSAEVMGHFQRVAAELGIAEAGRIENTKQFVLSALWTIYGAAALAIGIKRGTRAFRIGALLLLALAAAKVLAVDLAYYDADWHKLVFNQTFATFAVLVWALATSARYYAHSESVEERERSLLAPMLVASANVFALVGLSAEALGYYTAKISAGGLTSGALADLHLAQQLSLSVVWAIYGGAMLTFGIARRNKMLRLMALGLLGLTIFKVFLFDLSSLEKLYRIISFIVLGAILLAVSFLYQRYRQQVAELIGDVETQAPMSAEPE